MLVKKIPILLFILLSLFVLESCNEDPTDIGEELLAQDQIDVLTFDSATDTIQISSSYYKRTINLGTSSRLLLGKNGNVEAGILIKFNLVLDDTLITKIMNNSVSVESAWMQFTSNYRYGAETDPLDVNVFNITSGWTSSGFNSDSLAFLQYDNVDQKSADTSDTRIDINPQLAFNWLKAAADTAIQTDKGAYIKSAASSNKIIGYYAVGNDNSVIPFLSVVFKNNSDGALDTLVYYTYADVGVVSGELPQLGNDYTIIQAGLEAVSKLNFDLNRIPKNAVINKATVTLIYDTTKSVLGSSYINSLTAAMILDSANTDSVSSSVILNNYGNTFSGDITYITQNWVRYNNSGLLVGSSNRLLGVELFAIYGAASDVALKPRLIITYTTKK